MKFVNGSMIHEIGDIVIWKLNRKKYKILEFNPNYIKVTNKNWVNTVVAYISYDEIEVPLVEYCKALKKRDQE